jgi:hypothetical protein
MRNYWEKNFISFSAKYKANHDIRRTSPALYCADTTENFCIKYRSKYIQRCLKGKYQ